MFYSKDIWISVFAFIALGLRELVPEKTDKLYTP